MTLERSLPSGESKVTKVHLANSRLQSMVPLFHLLQSFCYCDRLVSWSSSSRSLRRVLVPGSLGRGGGAYQVGGHMVVLHVHEDGNME